MFALELKDISIINKILAIDSVNFKQPSKLLGKKSDNNATTLMITIEFDVGLDIIEKLLKFGDNVDCCDKNGNSPLIIAIKQQRPQYIQILIDFKADLNYC
jgi:ankyrin repeat protein